jgi:hypothetical protein
LGIHLALDTDHLETVEEGLQKKSCWPVEAQTSLGETAVDQGQAQSPLVGELNCLGPKLGFSNQESRWMGHIEEALHGREEIQWG